MTVKEVIETVDALRPNEIAAEDKRKWLYELESRYMRICMLRTSMRESGLPIRKRY
ncbi:MAG: hypothetical protein ACLS48_08255 [[Eubacterium] siraeum]